MNQGKKYVQETSLHQVFVKLCELPSQGLFEQNSISFNGLSDILSAVRPSYKLKQRTVKVNWIQVLGSCR